MDAEIVVIGLLTGWVIHLTMQIGELKRKMNTNEDAFYCLAAQCRAMGTRLGFTIVSPELEA